MTHAALQQKLRHSAPRPDQIAGSLSDGRIARIDWRARRARCASSECDRVITRLVRIGRTAILRPIFNGEWHEGEDRVWRLTSYARAMRQRDRNQARPSPGRALGLSRRRLWSDPTTWQPVVAAVPCLVECPECRTVQTIRLG
jgi:hypothetical protein